MKIVFMGTPDFAVPALQKLIDSGHQIVAVYTKEPKPAGQHLCMKYSPVYQLAEKNNLPIYTPKTFKNPEAVEAFQNLDADLGVVCAYGLILPQVILDAPKMGCWNIHASLLPRWRGAAPIQRAIEAGDIQTGITIMKMDAGIDTGDILSQEKVDITPNMTGGQLHDILSTMGADLLLQTIEAQPAPIKQPEEGIYAKKLSDEDMFLDWNMSADQVCNAIRAFAPYPGKRVYLDKIDSQNQIKIYCVEVVDISHNTKPGTAIDDKLLIACGKNAVRIQELQRSGKAKQSAHDFLNGTVVAKGTYLLGLDAIKIPKTP
ncbi:MAG: methionyl-tRNA formyltransferase [Alphaproteobacteria bacterium]|nr:methionyl-tRNA formyltransferase [Alphaproteobacteria bacterium]